MDEKYEKTSMKSPRNALDIRTRSIPFACAFVLRKITTFTYHPKCIETT